MIVIDVNYEQKSKNIEQGHNHESRIFKIVIIATICVISVLAGVFLITAKYYKTSNNRRIPNELNELINHYNKDIGKNGAAEYDELFQIDKNKIYQNGEDYLYQWSNQNVSLHYIFQMNGVRITKITFTFKSLNSNYNELTEDELHIAKDLSAYIIAAASPYMEDHRDGCNSIWQNMQKDTNNKMSYSVEKYQYRQNNIRYTAYINKDKIPKKNSIYEKCNGSVEGKLNSADHMFGWLKDILQSMIENNNFYFNIEYLSKIYTM